VARPIVHSPCCHQHAQCSVQRTVQRHSDHFSRGMPPYAWHMPPTLLLHQGTLEVIHPCRWFGPIVLGMMICQQGVTVPSVRQPLWHACVHYEGRTTDHRWDLHFEHHERTRRLVATPARLGTHHVHCFPVSSVPMGQGHSPAWCARTTRGIIPKPVETLGYTHGPLARTLSTSGYPPYPPHHAYSHTTDACPARDLLATEPRHLESEL
jgi:hypothetical protein